MAASSCNRMMVRRASAPLASALRSTVRTPSSLTRSTATSSSRLTTPISPASSSSPLRRLLSSRSLAELGGTQSLLPLHSAVATARMTSCLSTTSRSCRALSQVFGLSVPR